MSQIDLFADSQDDPRDDMIEIQNEDNDEQPSAQSIMKELKEVKKNQEETLILLKELTRKVMQPNVFHVETSTIKKPFTVFLKTKFSRGIWLNEDDIEVKTKARELIRNSGIAVETSHIVKCMSFALYQFTNWRNQLRHKMLTTERDVARMQLPALHKYLFGGFRFDDTAPSNMRTTIALRAFVDSRGLFYQKDVKIEFWKIFKKLFESIEESKWEKLEEKQNKKIQDLLRNED